MKQHHWMGLAFFLTLAACGDHAPSNAELDGFALGIAGGKLVTADQDAGAKSLLNPLLASIKQNGYKPHCSGVLISDRLLLTAAHCLYDTETKQFTPKQDLEISTCVDKKAAPCQWNKVKAYAVHPEFRRYKKEIEENTNMILASKWNNDIALVHLVTPVSSRKFISLAETEPELDETHRVYGRGRTQRDQSADGLQRFVELKVGSAFQFDFPADALSDRMLLRHTGTAGACPGDSGGPAVAKRDGQWFLTGISSHTLNGLKKDFACETQAQAYVRVDLYADWIKEKSMELLR